MRPPDRPSADSREPRWSTVSEAIRVVLHPPFFRKTLLIAVTVGAVLFLINHLDEILAGQVTAGTWVKGVVTCVVPFAVANWGILAATRRDKTPSKGA